MIVIYILFILFVVLNIFDAYLTHKIISAGGVELNPIMRYFMKAVGTTWHVWKIILVTVGCGVFVAYFCRTNFLFVLVFLIVLNFIYAIVVVHNYYIEKELEP
jgi:hypothetical protein